MVDVRELNLLLHGRTPETKNYESKYMNHPHSPKIELLKPGRGRCPSDLVRFKESPKSFYKVRRPRDDLGYYMKRLPLMNPYPKVLNHRKFSRARRRPTKHIPRLSDIEEDSFEEQEEEEKEDSVFADSYFNSVSPVRTHSESDLSSHISHLPKHRKRRSIGSALSRIVSRFCSSPASEEDF